jgi:hypothetical protein
MGDSVEYRNGVFVATGPTKVGGLNLSGGSATGTALMVRPTGHLAPVDAPGPLVGADLPPTGPTLPSASTAPAAGGARRIAVATIIASLIAAMAFGAAAFGGGFGGQSTPTPAPTSSSARGALGAAAAASTAATSVAFTVSATRTTSSTTATLVVGSGAVDLTTNTAKLTATVPALSGLVGRGNDTVNVVADGSTVSLGSPALSTPTGGFTWLKTTLPKDSSHADSSTLAVLANPAQLLGLLSSVGGKVTTVDNVNLHGTPTTEYSTTATLAHLGSRAGLTARSKFGSQVSRILQQLGNALVPVTVWVGKDGFVRQISASLDLSRATLGSLAADLINGVVNGALPTGTSGQSTTATTVVVGFSHYNAPVTVTMPPASQTTDVNQVVHSVQGVVSGIRHAVSIFASKF